MMKKNKTAAKKVLSASTIGFLKKYVLVKHPEVKSFNEDTVLDLLGWVEQGIEIPLVQDQEEGKAVDQALLDSCRRVIDDLNVEDIDVDDLNKRLF